MKDMEKENSIESRGEIVLYQPDEKTRLEVRIDSDTVWLSQQQMAHLFDVKENTITYHLKEIYNSRELDVESTARKIRVVRLEGTRKVNRQIDFYNLDMILSIGYRVNSVRGIMFRRWSSTVLKQYLLQGYSINRQLVVLQQQVDSRFEALEHRVDEQQQQVEFLVDMHRQPEERIFSTGCVFDAWEYVAALVREAKNRIVLIDNYCDERTLTLLSKRQSNVECTIYTRFNEAFDTDLEKHNRQYPAIKKVQLPQKEHDRGSSQARWLRSERLWR